MPIKRGNAENETMVNGICSSPMAPKVQTMPSNTTGIGSSGHFTCLKSRSSAKTIKTPARSMICPWLLFMASVMDFMRAEEPVTVMLYPGGKSASETASFVSFKISLRWSSVI